MTKYIVNYIVTSWIDFNHHPLSIYRGFIKDLKKQIKVLMPYILGISFGFRTVHNCENYQMTSSVCRYRNSRLVTYFLQWDHVKSNSLCRSDIMERWRVWLIACCYSDRSHAQYLRKDGSPWGRLNIRTSYPYRDSHYKDKTVSWPSYLKMEIPYLERQRPYAETRSWYLVK